MPLSRLTRPALAAWRVAGSGTGLAIRSPEVCVYMWQNLYHNSVVGGKRGFSTVLVHRFYGSTPFLESPPYYKDMLSSTSSV